MKIRFTAFTVIFFCLIIFHLNIIAEEESIEYMLACINAGRKVDKNDLSIKRFRSLLKQLSQKFGENKQEIADMSVKAVKLLKEDGISESLLKIMESMNQLFYGKVENQKYAEYMAIYLTLRNKGQTHEQAIDSIKALLRSFGIK